MNNRPLFALGALAIAVTPALAQQQSSLPPINVGATAGIYIPSSKEIRSDLGSGVLQLGVGPVGTTRPSEGSITPDFSITYIHANGNSLFILPITYGYEYHFGVDQDSTTIPYARVFAGVSYFDYSITDTAGEHFGVKRLGATTGAEAGFILGKRLKVSARYNFYTPTSGFTFNGLSLTATYSLFTF